MEPTDRLGVVQEPSRQGDSKNHLQFGILGRLRASVGQQIGCIVRVLSRRRPADRRAVSLAALLRVDARAGSFEIDLHTAC